MKKTGLLCIALLTGASIYALGQLQKSVKAERQELFPSGKAVALKSIENSTPFDTPRRATANLWTEEVDVYNNIMYTSLAGRASVSLEGRNCNISLSAGAVDHVMIWPKTFDYLKGRTRVSFDLTSDGKCKVTPCALYYGKHGNNDVRYSAYEPVEMELAGESSVTVPGVAFTHSGFSSLTASDYYHGFMVMVEADTDVNLILSDISMVQTHAVAPTAVTQCPVDMGQYANAYLQLDDTSWLGFCLLQLSSGKLEACVTGISTTDDKVVFPDKIKCPEINGNNEIPVIGIGIGSNRGVDYDIDWSLCPNLKSIEFCNVPSFEIATSFNNSPVTDIYFPKGSYYSSKGRFRTDGVKTNVHVPVGSSSNFKGKAYWSNCEILTGDETPGMPTMYYSEYRVKVGDNGYVGVSVEDNAIAVSEIYTQSEEFVIPDSLPYGYAENKHSVAQVGVASTSNRENALFFQAPNIKSLTLPSGVNRLYIDFSNSPVTELHFSGCAPNYSNWEIPLSIPLYVKDQNYYASFISKYPNHNVLTDGWDFEWLTLDVQKPGEFAQTYLEATDNNWGSGMYVKINGPINSVDMSNIKKLSSLMKLDLSGTEIEYLPSKFLADNTLLKEVILPTSLKTIGSNAFRGCEKLLSVTVNGENNISKINEYAFENCVKLNVFDASKVETIGSSAFKNCISFNPSSIESAKSIDSYAFSGSGIKEIGPGFFSTELATLPSYAFYNCVYLKSVELQDNITIIANDCFENCYSLSSLKLPGNLFSIGDRAFYNIPIKTLDLPDYLRMIGSDAFTYCWLLTKVISRSVAPPMSDGVFMDQVNYTNIDLFVPPISLDYYRVSTNWSSFYKMYGLEDPIDYIYVDRPVAIELSEDINEQLSHKPDMVLVDYYLDNYYRSAYVGQLTIDGEGTMSTSVIDIYPKLDYRDNGKNLQWNRPSIINNADKMRTDSISVHMELYKNKWHFITLPYDVKVSDIVPSADTYWSIRRYDSAKRAEGELGATWVDLTNEDTMEAGKGYIVRAYNEEKNPVLTFPSRNTTTKNNIFRSNDVIVELEEHISEFAHNRSWNLVGNPYPAYVYTPELQDQNGDQLRTPITVWRGSSYQAYSPVDDELILRPYESFFIQRPLDSETIIFPKDSRYHFNTVFNYSTAGTGMCLPSRNGKDDISDDNMREVFDFKVSDGSMLDNRARIVLNEAETLGYDIDCDAVKFFTTENSNPLIFVAADQNYEINERPFDNGFATLGVQLSASGEYTISLGGKHAGDWKVWLTDTYTGATVNLMESEYTFNGEQSTDPHRFTVRFEKPVSSGIESVETIPSDAFVVVTTIDGVVIYNGTMSEFDAPESGTYIISVDGNGKKVFVSK